MDINDIDRRASNNRLSIPIFHRAHLSLMPESEYSVLYLKRNSQWTTGDNVLSAMDQILVTPHPFDDWEHLWIMSCTMKERPGIVRDILTILKSFRVNVLSQTSKAVHTNKYHQIDIVFSTRQSEEATKTVRRIQETIIANYLPEVRLKFTGEPELSIFQLIQYKYLKERFLQITTHSERYREILAAKKINKNIILDIPEFWFEELMTVTESNSESGLRYIMHTNTVSQLLSVYFPHSSRSLVSGRINHRDEVGAIAAFTSAFSEIGINLISSLTRKKHQQINQFEFICEKEQVMKEAALEEIKKALATPQCLIFEPRLSVPDYNNFRWSNWEEIWNWTTTGVNLFELKKSLQSEPLNVSIIDTQNRKKTETLLHQLRKDLLSTDTLSTHMEMTHQIHILENLLRDGVFAKPAVFISHKIMHAGEENYSHMNQLIKIINSIFEKNGFDTVIGIGEAQGLDLVEVIGSRINDCHFYLGVLSKNTKDGRPSEWVIWEYGYGSKQCLHSRLMKEKSVDLPSVIVAPANEFSFTDLDSVEGQKKITDLIQIYASEFKKIWLNRSLF